MPINLELSDTEILVDLQGVLFHVNMELTKRRIELETRLKNKMLTCGDFRGTIVSIDAGTVRTRCESKGTERSFPLTRQRVRQLLAEINRT